MLTVELLTLKFQELLGSKYSVRMHNDYNTNFYTVVFNEMYGQNMLAVDKDAFKRYEDVIPVVLTTKNPVRSNVPYYLIRADFTLEFWVPINADKKDKNGKLLEPVKFTFEKDIEKLLNSIINQSLTMQGDLRARMSLSEPAPVGQPEDTGTFRRMRFICNGTAQITDKGIFGSDVKYALRVPNANKVLTWVDIEGVNSVNDDTSYDAAGANRSESIRTELRTMQLSNSLVLEVEDFDSSSRANWKIRELQRTAPDEVTPLETTRKRKLMIKVRATYPSVEGAAAQVVEYYAVPSVIYRSTGLGTGVFVCTFARDNTKEA